MEKEADRLTGKKCGGKERSAGEIPFTSTTGTFSRSTTHGPIERQKIYFMAHNAARMDRFKGCQLYRDSQPNTCAAYDVIASDHSCIAATWERSRNENSWKLVLNSEGANGHGSKFDKDRNNNSKDMI